MYAKLEEEYGLARHAMAVYERATQAVETDERHHMFNIYIKRAAEIYGVTYTRAIYQKAIEVECIFLFILKKNPRFFSPQILAHHIYFMIKLHIHKIKKKIVYFALPLLLKTGYWPNHCCGRLYKIFGAT